MCGVLLPQHLTGFTRLNPRTDNGFSKKNRERKYMMRYYEGVGRLVCGGRYAAFNAAFNRVKFCLMSFA